MGRFRAVAEGLEGYLHLDRPAPGEAAGAHVPHRVPVTVGIALVRELLVGAGPEGIRVEVEAVAAVVEGVEEGGERVVLAELAGVAAHLVGDPLTLGGRVPDPGGDVDVDLVEEDPRLGPLGGGGADVGHLLDEPGDRGDGLVDPLVEHPVEADALGQPDRPDRGAPFLVARHHLGRDRGRRSVDERCERRGSAGQEAAGRHRPRLGGRTGGRRGRPPREWRRPGDGRRLAGTARGRRPDRSRSRPPGRAGAARRCGPSERGRAHRRSGRAGRGTLARGACSPGGRLGRRQREHQAVLQVEQIVRAAIDDGGTDDAAGGHRHDPGGDAEPTAEPLIGADQHERHVEGAAHAGGIPRRHRRGGRLIGRNGAVPPRDDRRPRREPGRERLGDAQAHPVVDRTARQVGERDDGHRTGQRAADGCRGRLPEHRDRRQRHACQYRPQRPHPTHTSRSHVYDLISTEPDLATTSRLHSIRPIQSAVYPTRNGPGRLTL